MELSQIQQCFNLNYGVLNVAGGENCNRKLKFN